MAQATPAGRFRDRITVQARAAGQDAHGRPNGAWQTVAEPWAAQLNARATERFAAGQQNATVDVGLVIRWRTDIDAGMRIVWRGVVHELVGVPTDIDGMRRELVLLCVAGVRNTHD